MVSGGIYVPFPKPDLVGRESAIEGLHHALGFDQPVALMPALTGQGGVGKTQLAILYAYEKASYYPGGVFWLNASGLTADPATSQDPKTIVRQLADYATQLGLKTDVSAQDDADRQRALRWLGEVRQRKDVLLIVDNVDDTGLLIRDLPSLPNNRLIGLGCRIIVTSRHRDLPGCKSMQVELLARPHDRELLLREALRSPRSAGDQNSLEDICGLLGGLPLALRVAGALLQKNKTLSLSRFAAVLRERGAITIADQPDARVYDYEKSLRAVLAESWNRLRPEQEHLKQVMGALSCLPAAQQVPTALLPKLTELPQNRRGLPRIRGVMRLNSCII